MRRKGKGWIWTLLALALFALDASTKYWAESHLLPLDHAPPFYPYGGVGVFRDLFGIDLSLNLTKNTGAAWNFFSNYPRALLFIRIGVILSLIVYTLFINKEKKRALPLLLIIVGASANIFDFFIYGGVIDFFYFVLWGYSYPVFNVADVLIFLGVFTLLIQSFRESLKKKRSHASIHSKG